MELRIQTLPAEVVHLIAAGEVIDSLSAAVRELVENALDAGATRITVSVWVNQWRVRVADNGSGMNLNDLQHAATPHSTSKIKTSTDLWQIKSLGFRGEALHSLAHLADLEICSRLAGSSEGWRVTFDAQGQPSAVSAAAIAPGTIVTASNLFGNWLPRRQGLPNSAQQLRAVQATIQQLALCHPHVTWQVEQSDRAWFSIWAGKTAKHTLLQLLRDIQPSDLQELDLKIDLENPATQNPTVDFDSSPLTSQTHPGLYLLIGLPDRCHRHRPDWVRVAVNGRIVKAPELEQAVFSAFRRMLPRDRYPVCFLHLTVAPDQIDWNRHPAKTEMYLHHTEIWQEKTVQAIAQAIRLSSTTLPDIAYSDRVGQFLKAAESQGAYGSSRSISDTLPHSSASATDPEQLQPSVRSQAPIALKAIAQVRNMYILAEHANGMWLVEQHIAHERVLYEQLRDCWHLVSLETPVILSHLSQLQVEQLQRIGVDIEPFGEQLWAIRTVPEPLALRDDCPDALLELSFGGNLEAALVAIACRTAIRNGTPLTLHEMQTLINQWQHTQHPRTCPHGRPIYLPLEESSLSRFFRRHWVVGKSHGI